MGTLPRCKSSQYHRYCCGLRLLAHPFANLFRPSELISAFQAAKEFTHALDTSFGFIFRHNSAAQRAPRSRAGQRDPALPGTERLHQL
ncbi:MAG: hypothetical protein M3N23_10360, partial [Pseudomonadota bacterium]|nr:hypothetical protein [Pseudomonadota bacterium]